MAIVFSTIENKVKIKSGDDQAVYYPNTGGSIMAYNTRDIIEISDPSTDRRISISASDVSGAPGGNTD